METSKVFLASSTRRLACSLVFFFLGFHSVGLMARDQRDLLVQVPNPTTEGNMAVALPLTFISNECQSAASQLRDLVQSSCIATWVPGPDYPECLTVRVGIEDCTATPVVAVEGEHCLPSNCALLLGYIKVYNGNQLVSSWAVKCSSSNGITEILVIDME